MDEVLAGLMGVGGWGGVERIMKVSSLSNLLLNVRICTTLQVKFSIFGQLICRQNFYILSLNLSPGNVSH